MAKKLQLHGSFPSKAGEPGGYYTPNVSNPDAETLKFTFTKSKEDMPAVPPVSVPIPSGAPEVHIGSEPPINGEKLWYNPDEEPEGDDASLEEVVSQVVDNCVPAWAKQPEKPKYTAEEVGALPADTPLPSGGAKWNLIADLTLEEDVEKLSITTDVDGQTLTDLGYSEVFIILYLLGKSGYSARYSDLNIWYSDSWTGGYSATYSNGANGYDMIANAIYAIAPPTNDSGNVPVRRGLTYDISHQGKYFQAPGGIRSVNMRATAGFIAGSRIIVYGR